MKTEQYINKRDLLCWLIKQRDNGRKYSLTIDEIAKGVDELPMLKMANREALVRAAVAEEGKEDGNRKIKVIMGDLEFLATRIL